MLKICQKRKSLCLFGDLNARTSTLPDYIEHDTVNEINIDLIFRLLTLKAQNPC